LSEKLSYDVIVLRVSSGEAGDEYCRGGRAGCGGMLLAGDRQAAEQLGMGAGCSKRVPCLPIDKRAILNSSDQGSRLGKKTVGIEALDRDKIYAKAFPNFLSD